MDRLATLRNWYAGPGDDLHAAARAAAAHLAGGDARGTVLVIVTSAGHARSFLWDVQTAVVQERLGADGPAPRPDLAIYVAAGTLGDMLNGRLSPVDAVFGARLRYEGDEGLGLTIFRGLSGSTDDIFEPCRSLARLK